MVFIFAFELFLSLGMTYVACELGHRSADAFEAISCEIGQLNWYSLPVDVRKMLPVFIAGAQQPVGLDVFGSISCGRQEFKTVHLTINIENRKVLTICASNFRS